MFKINRDPCQNQSDKYMIVIICLKFKGTKELLLKQKGGNVFHGVVRRSGRIIVRSKGKDSPRQTTMEWWSECQVAQAGTVNMNKIKMSVKESFNNYNLRSSSCFLHDICFYNHDMVARIGLVFPKTTIWEYHSKQKITASSTNSF